MKIDIGTIITKMEEAVEQLKAESREMQPSRQKIQEHAIALRAYAELLYVENETVKDSGRESPRVKQPPSIQQERIAPTVPMNDGGSLLDF